MSDDTIRDLEKELHNSQLIKSKVQDLEYAQALYAAMCNIQWYTDNPKESWTCSWRYAGGIVAELRDQNEDYCDFYCSGIGIKNNISEGQVAEEIEADLLTLGWHWQRYPDE